MALVTTSLRLILGLLKKQEGDITLFGKHLQANRIDILRRIGSLIEQPSLYLHLTGKENLEIFRLTYQCDKKRR
jgi:lantibiotic transport system ATP-binding protein